MNVKDGLFFFNCSDFNKIYEKEFNEDLAKRLENNYTFCDKDIKRFCLMIRKEVYPYECTDSCQRFHKTSFPDKKEFYSNLNMEDITNADCKHAKKGMGI